MEMREKEIIDVSATSDREHALGNVIGRRGTYIGPFPRYPHVNKKRFSGRTRSDDEH
jgi:hypothetical protein